jgi:DNA-binding CsgD family transcriptional regulator
LPALIPADVTVFGMANPRAQTLSAVENPRLTSAADLDTFMRLTGEGSNPPLEYYAMTGDPEARRMSDFVTRQQFHRLPIYTDFYRRLRVEFQLAVLVQNEPTAFDGLTLNRGRRDFDERDRSVLTLLGPHIIHGYRTAMAVDRLRADLALALRAVETPGFGVIVVSDSGAVQLLSPGAAELLASYFGSRRQADELPDSLNRWVRHHAEKAKDASQLPSLRTQFVVKRNGARLVVQLVRVARDTLLLLEEPATRSDWHRLEPLRLSVGEARVMLECLREEVVTGGVAMPEVVSRVISLLRDARPPANASHQLTPHEQRLVRLLTEGHSYKTAAAVLGSSVHTVAFHMKHIYAKLQVHSKSEAVAKALRERIGQ